MCFKDELLCSICRLLVKNPVSFPCNCTICDEHLFDGPERKPLITCDTCGDEFIVPKDGFKQNKLAQRILDHDLHLSVEERALKQSILCMNRKLAELLAEFESKKTSLESLCAYQFTEIRRQIDIQRELVKEKIDEIALKMIDQTKVAEAKYMKRLSDKARQNLQSDIEQVEVMLANEYRKPNLLYEKVKQLEVEQEDKLSRVLSIFKELGSVKQDVDAFEFKANQGFNDASFGNLKLKRHAKLLCYDRIDANIKIWDLEKNACILKLEGHRELISCLEVVDNNRLVSASYDKSIKVWDITKGTCVNTFSHDNREVICLTSWNKSRIASGSTSDIKVWNANSGECVQSFEGHQGAVYCLIYIPTGSRLVSGSDDQTIKVWDLRQGTCSRTLEHSYAIVFSLLLLQNGLVVSGSMEGTIHIWDLESGKGVRILNGHSDWVRGLQQRENGDLVSCSGDHSIKVWDLGSGDCIRTICVKSDVNCIKWCESGALISSSNAGSIQFWDLNTGECTMTFWDKVVSFVLI